MSYEKKKLAGVGNTHLYQYQTPGLMEQDHPDVYPMRMNPMQQYPCPMQPPPQQTHTMNPADQCLSTPQPPSQTSDMVDNGSCMAAVSRVVMEDPMQEPTDNLGLDDAYRTGETAVQQPTLEMPIRAEVVMEPDPNEDEAEPDGEDDVEKSRISSKKHCFVCNTQLPEDIETAVPFFKTETTKTNKKFSAVITKLVGRSITPRKAHSEIICRRCFNLLDRIDTLEVELRDSKDEVISMYKTTLDIYGGKTRRKRTVVSRKSPFLYSKNTKVGRTSAVKSPKIEKQETIEAQVPTTTQTVENVVDTGVPTTSYEQSCSSMPKGLEMDDDIDDMEDLDDSKKTEEEGSKDTAQKKRNRKFKDEATEMINFTSYDKLQGELEEVVNGYYIKQYRCPLCSVMMYTENLGQLKVHIEKQHYYGEEFICWICSKNLGSTLSDFYGHMISSHKEHFPIFRRIGPKGLHKSKYKIPGYSCQICLKIIPAPHVSAHEYIHGNKKACPHCGEVFALSYLCTHINRKHKEAKTFKCSHCDLVYDNKYYLTTHIKRHHEVRNTHCSLCDKSFISEYDKKRHVKHVHENVRSFVCEVCGQAYKTCSGLTYHKRRKHTNEKPLICEHCGKAFACPSGISKHTITVHKVAYKGKYQNRYHRATSGYYIKKKPKTQETRTIDEEDISKVIIKELRPTNLIEEDMEYVAEEYLESSFL